MKIAVPVCIAVLTCLAYCGCANTKDEYVPTVEITTRVMPDAIEGTPYSYQLGASGGVGTSYYWTLVDGELPAGISLLSSGVLSGTPLSTGGHTFTVNVRELTAGFISDNATEQLSIAVKAWQRPAPVTTSSTDSRNPAAVMDSSGVLHGVWEEGAPGSTEIYYSAQLGTTAAAPANISSTAGDSVHPSMASDSSDNLHLVWSEYVGATYQVMYANYDGTSWTSATDVCATTVNSSEPVVAVDQDDNVHFVWVESSAGGDEIMWSLYDGTSQSSPAVISGSVNDCGAPAVWAQTSVYVVFSGGTGTSSEIHLTSFSGGSWSTPVNLSDDAVESAQPAIHGAGDVFVAWSSGAPASQLIAYRTLHDQEWSDVGFAETSGGYASLPSAVVDSDTRATIMWEDGSTTRSLFMMQIASGEATLPTAVFNASASMVEPSLAIDTAGKIYGLYSSEGSPDYQIGYTGFAQRVWREPVEIPVTGTNPRSARITMDSQGTAHCIWQQDEGSGVRNIYYSSLESGYSWASPTLVSISNTKQLDHPHISIDNNDCIHAVWGGYDSGDIYQVWYSAYEAGTWLVPVQATSGTTDHSYWPDIAVSSTGSIHVVFGRYVTADADQEIFYVCSNDGITWSVPSSVSESSTLDSWGPSIEIDGSDTIHVTWSEDNDIAYKSFDGLVWSPAENLSNNTGASFQPDIVPGENGTMLVAWQDDTSGTHYPMYSYYDGTTWSTAANVVDSIPGRCDWINAAHHEGTFYAAWGQAGTPMGREIWFASFDGSSWATPVNLATEAGAYRLGTTGGAISCDSDGTIHVAFTNSDTDKNWYTRK